jgi:hypothetical protein
VFVGCWRGWRWAVDGRLEAVLSQHFQNQNPETAGETGLERVERHERLDGSEIGD